MAIDLLTVGMTYEDLIFHGLPRLPKAGEELRTDGFHRTWGGGALIAAVAAARLGTATSAFGPLAEGAAAFLEHEGIHIINARQPHEPHALTVAISTRHDRSFVTYRGINEQAEQRMLAQCTASPQAVPAAAATARHVHFNLRPRDCPAWSRVLERLRERGVTTSWDFGFHQGLQRARGFRALVNRLDHLFLNELEARTYSGCDTIAAATRYWRDVNRSVVIKLGRRGCRWLREGTELRAAALSVSAVDTTGAGDAFNGGFLHAMLRGFEPEHCLRVATAVAGKSVTCAGGLDGLPRARDLPAGVCGVAPPNYR